MKNSNFFYIAALVILFSSCGSQNQEAKYYEEFDTNQMGEYNNVDQGNYNQEGNYQEANYQEINQPNNSQNNSKAKRGSSKVEMKTIMDNQTGLPYCYMPLPANWKLNPKTTGNEPAITGPNDINVYNVAFKTFVYSNDQYMAQMYQQAGQQMRRPVGSKNVKNELQAELNKNGYTFVKQYDLPGVAQSDKNYNDKLWKVGPMQSTFGATASEWVNQNGKKILILTHYFEHAGQGLVSWGYYGNAMETPASEFENAAQTLIYAATNIKYNDQQIQAHNRSEQQKSNQSWASHNQKMKNNQANFEATQQAYRSSNDAINNSIMSTYRNQSASSDRTQQRYINSIREENTVTNPYDGQQYQVDQNYNQTWMNSNGDYIQSNDAYYNPNGDQNVYQYDWQEVEPEY
ncbi:MAG: hypothetical protein R2728_01675 [Chitinophagales bacterium]